MQIIEILIGVDMLRIDYKKEVHKADINTLEGTPFELDLNRFAQILLILGSSPTNKTEILCVLGKFGCCLHISKRNDVTQMILMIGVHINKLDFKVLDY